MKRPISLAFVMRVVIVIERRRAVQWSPRRRRISADSRSTV